MMKTTSAKKFAFWTSSTSAKQFALWTSSYVLPIHCKSCYKTLTQLGL